ARPGVDHKPLPWPGLRRRDRPRLDAAAGRLRPGRPGYQPGAIRGGAGHRRRRDEARDPHARGAVPGAGGRAAQGADLPARVAACPTVMGNCGRVPFSQPKPGWSQGEFLLATMRTRPLPAVFWVMGWVVTILVGALFFALPGSGPEAAGRGAAAGP